MKKFILIFLSLLPFTAFCQSITDGVMMPKGSLCTGVMYSHDQWTHYWEGSLNRTNGNIGTVTTQSASWVGAFGVTGKLNLIAMVPFVWTKDTQGTLHPMSGLQDISVAGKYNFFQKSFGENSFSAFGTLTFSTPLSNYTPDFLPLSIGLASTNLSWRLTGHYSWKAGWYVNATGAYTWRSNVRLDRPSYFTDGTFYISNEVKMPNVMDYIASFGYRKNSISAEVNFYQQSTLGGGDIRRQDMPFVSNRMNFSKVGASVQYFVPSNKNLSLKAGTAITVAGRNVGQSTTFSGGFLYTLNF